MSLSIYFIKLMLKKQQDQNATHLSFLSFYPSCSYEVVMYTELWQTGSDATYLQYELLQLRLFVFNPLESSLPLGLQETHRITLIQEQPSRDIPENLHPTDLQILTFLRRVGGESDPFDLLLVFGDDVHGHQDVQSVVNPSADVLLIVHVLEDQKQEPSEQRASLRLTASDRNRNWPPRSERCCCLRSWTPPPARPPPRCRTSPPSSAPSHTLSWRNAANPSRSYRPSCCACRRSYWFISHDHNAKNHETCSLWTVTFLHLSTETTGACMRSA